MSLRGGNSPGSSFETMLANSLSKPPISIEIFVEGKTLRGKLGKEIEYEANSLANDCDIELSRILSLSKGLG